MYARLPDSANVNILPNMLQIFILNRFLKIVTDMVEVSFAFLR